MFSSSMIPRPIMPFLWTINGQAVRVECISPFCVHLCSDLDFLLLPAEKIGHLLLLTGALAASSGHRRRIVAAHHGFLSSLHGPDLDPSLLSNGLKGFFASTNAQPQMVFIFGICSISHGGFRSNFFAVENTASWPQQLLEGHTFGLAKTLTAEEVGQNRPVVITSTVHRAWSSLRAKQILHQIAPAPGPFRPVSCEGLSSRTGNWRDLGLLPSPGQTCF